MRPNSCSSLGAYRIAQKFDAENFDKWTIDEQNFDKLIVGFKGKALSKEGWLEKLPKF